jgi:enamine deaminase RidA (YjgF/YER057c/UK114 family)
VSPSDRPRPRSAPGSREAAPKGDTRSESREHPILHPHGWPRPKGYAYGVVADGRLVCLSGIIGWDEHGRITSDDFVGQVQQALTNIVALLREAHATPADIVRMTWYVVDKREYLAVQADLGEAYRAILGRHFPAMTVVEVSGLLEDRARVEIEVTAVVR